MNKTPNGTSLSNWTPQELQSKFGPLVDKRLQQLHYPNVLLSSFTSDKTSKQLHVFRIVLRNVKKIYIRREVLPHLVWLGRACWSWTSQKIVGKRRSHNYTWTFSERAQASWCWKVPWLKIHSESYDRVFQNSLACEEERFLLKW